MDATALQIADKTGDQSLVIDNLRSAHAPGDLAALVRAGIAKLRAPGRGTLDFEIAAKPRVESAVVKSNRSRLLIYTIRSVHERRGFEVIDNKAFFQLVTARLAEATSRSDSV